MKKIGSLIVLVALGVVAYNYRAPIGAAVVEIKNIIAPPAPCTQTIDYSLGDFDARFGVSKSMFLLSVAQAAQIWNDAAKRPLLRYADGGSLKINLIYDYRQKATNDLQGLGLVIKDDSSSYDALKAKYDSLNSAYNSQKATLQSMIDRFTADKNAYEQQVAYWNARGGAPKPQYDQLEQQKQALAAEAGAINSATASLNALVEQVNSAATVLNRLAAELNLNVKSYNTIGASTGVEFDEGQYVSDSTGTRIDIYQFENQAKLVRVLAHELGHALGLGHIEDPKAIMYRLNQGTNETPTAADISELKRVCGVI